MYSNHEFVPLPGGDYGVMLRPTLAKLLVVLISAGERGATASEVDQDGGLNASKLISRLRATGAVILTIPASYIVYPNWTYMDSEARYAYLTWNDDNPNRYPISKKRGP